MASFAVQLQEAVSAASHALATAEATSAALQAQLDAADAQVTAERRQLVAAKRALREHEDEALKQLVLAPLFPELASLVFAQLPVDSRLRCREVCRGWCAFLADVRHWQVLDLGLNSGVARRTPALLHAACELARGTLRSLDVSGWDDLSILSAEPEVALQHLLPVLRANAASLLELRSWRAIRTDDFVLASVAGVEALLDAAPRLRVLECDVNLAEEDAHGPVPRLFLDPRFAVLRLQTLQVDATNVQPPLDVLAVLSCAASHASLKHLGLVRFQLAGEPELGALLNLAISKLQGLDLQSCNLSPPVLPALTRMLSESRTLTYLCIYNSETPLLLGAALPAFCTALRESRLTTLELCQMRLWESLGDGLAVVAACTGHPTLCMLSLAGHGLDEPTAEAVGIALAALVAADSALEALNLTDCGLDDESLRPLFAGVSRSTKLRDLDLTWNEDITEDCAEEYILPAVQENTSLRRLGFSREDIAALAEAVELVAARATASET